MCLAAYLWFPLHRRRSIEQVTDAKRDDLGTESPEPEMKAASSSEILHALQVIQLGVSAGMTIGQALECAQKRTPAAVAREIERGLNQYRIGHPLTRALEEIAIINPRWQSISDTLITSLNSGSPISDQLADVEFILQSSIDTEKLKRIKSVAVKSVLPLGLCFLPAFVLLAVVPIVAGLIRGFI
jgi:pilus assembly protein TadC